MTDDTETTIMEEVLALRKIANRIIPSGESKPFDRTYKKRFRKQLQRRGYNYSTIRNHGYSVYLTAIKDKVIDIAFPITNGLVSIQVNVVERDQSITIPHHEPQEGLSFKLMDMADIEYLKDLSAAFATDIPYMQDNGLTWMMWSIPILRSKAYTIEAAKAAILKRAGELDISFTHHVTYPTIGSEVSGGQICMIGLGPMEKDRFDDQFALDSDEEE